MRVCLIIPPSGFLLDERVFPSLGVLKVAAVLEQRGIEVQVMDYSGHDIKNSLVIPAADVYGITATMPQMPAAASIAQYIKHEFHDRPLVLGGPHVTLLNASAKQEDKRTKVGRATVALHELMGIFDVLICGDGEHAMVNLLVQHRLDTSRALPQLIDADEPKTSLFLTKDDLNALPFAARHLIDLDSYRYEIDGYRTHSLIGQLGCPFGCTFCGGRRSPFLRRVRTRTTENVVAEVRHLHEVYGARGFMFLDDELNVNTQFMDLLAQLRQLQDTLGVDFKFRGLLKSQLLTDEMAASMAATGFRQILVGFESGHPRILQNMRKQATREQNTRCVELLHTHGIKCKALMSFGHAGETPETIEATRAWLLDVQPDDFDVTIITIYPGTPYYDDATKRPQSWSLQPHVWTYADPVNGDLLHSYEVDQLRDVNFYKGVPGQYQSFVWTEALTRQQLVDLRDDVETSVRAKLNIPWPTSPAAKQYEHSMGLR